MHSIFCVSFDHKSDMHCARYNKASSSSAEGQGDKELYRPNYQTNLITVIREVTR